MPKRKLSNRRLCSSVISAIPALEKCRPGLIFLVSTSCNMRSITSPICSILMVKLIISVQRLLSVSPKASLEILVK